MALDPDVWGPHYWFVLMTIALCYPLNPNDVTKKKYYDLIHNIPLLLPVEKLGNNFSNLIDQYPVTPYLDSRDSFIKWTHFIHNKVNQSLDKPEIDFYTALDKYYFHYKPKEIINKDSIRFREKLIFIAIILLTSGLIVYLYKK
jgi:hypothetical protein